jgi:hypothetical protein
MRKAYKRKRRSCALCKPDKRWKPKESAHRLSMHDDCRQVTGSVR